MFGGFYCNGKTLSFQALGLSSESMGRTTTGQIVNLLSNDVNRFDEVKSCGTRKALAIKKSEVTEKYQPFLALFPQITLNLHYLWVGPLQAIVIIVFLWYEIGPSCLAGLSAIALMVPVQTWFGKLFGIFR